MSDDKPETAKEAYENYKKDGEEGREFKKPYSDWSIGFDLNEDRAAHKRRVNDAAEKGFREGTRNSKYK